MDTTNESSNAEPKSNSTKRWVMTLVLAIILVFLFTLPEMLRMVAVRWVNQQQQIQHFSLDDIDLNLFSGEVGLKGVKVSGDGKAQGQLGQVYVNIAMLALIQQRIEIEQLRIANLKLDLYQDDQANNLIAGIALPSPTTDSEPEPQPVATEASGWGVGIQAIELSDLNIQLSVPNLSMELVLDQLNLGSAATWQADKAANVDMVMRIQGAPLSVRGDITPFAKQANTQFQLELNKLPLSLVAAMAKQQGIEDLAGTLSIKLDVNATVDGDIKVASQLNLTDLALRQANHQLTLASIDWQGDVRYGAQVSDNDLGVRLEGELDLDKLNINDNAAGIELLILEQMNINALRLAQEQTIEIGNISIANVAALVQADKSVARLAAIELKQLSYDGNSALSIDTLDLKTLTANIEIDKAGELPMLAVLKHPQTTDSATASAAEAPLAEPEAQLIRVQLKRLHLGEDSQVHFLDQSVKPPYKANILPLELTVTDIDTGSVEQDIVIAMQATINELAQLTLDANVRPFGDHLNLAAEGKLQDLDMPPLSPYAMKAAGYYLKRGQANATFNARVVDDQLESKIKLKLNKFNIEAGDPDKVKRMNENLSMPLDLALNILRDKKDNIELELIIDGDINDPQFDASKVINKALGNATKFAAAHVLKQSLQPWGAVFSVVSFLGKQITTPRFDPVRFTPGGSELNEEHRQYMGKMATLLGQRPGLDLNICALASEQDRQALTSAPDEKQESKESPADGASAKPPVSNQTLIDLAKNRMDKVKQLLMDHGIVQGRLFTCQPTMDDAEKAEPTVELYL